MCFFLYVIVTSTCMFIYTVYTCVGEDFKFTKNVSDLFVIECDYILCLKLNSILVSNRQLAAAPNEKKRICIT
jgi:hypothetical protein